MKRLAIMAYLVILNAVGFANNLQITNVTVLASSNQVQFDISWDNSWRSDVLLNWDAAWVFMKYKDIDGNWKHFDFTNSNNVVPSGFAAEVSTDSKGVMLFRSVLGSGTTTITGIKLGIPVQQALGVFDIKVFGTEMVYIPKAPFYAGDFNTSTSSIRAGSANNLPMLISAANSAVQSGIYDPISALVINFSGGTYPYGRDSFYCMKYEISQGAYRDFLNTLTYAQQVNRTENLPTGATGTPALTNSGNGRSSLEIATPGVATTTPAVYGCDGNNNNVYNEPGDGEWVACNYLNWPDLAAYLEWSCLSPMTELQYEKICRGPNQPVTGEYAWGTTQVANSVYTLANASAVNESISNLSLVTGEGNAAYGITGSSFGGPVRTGIFATSTSNRISSGGSFYGVMEMNGNLSERAVTLATNQGRIFPGTNGSGTLSVNGNATKANWPARNNTTTEVDGSTTATGIIYKGSSYTGSASNMRVSDRSTLETTTAVTRGIDWGGRGVRNY